MAKMTRRMMVERGLLTAGGALAFRAGATGALAEPSSMARSPKATNSSTKNGLTHYVSEFVVNTTYADIPANVIELGKKSILDGLGLALVGSVVKTGKLSQEYLNSLGLL
ncbi:MAG: hypothetical protein ACRD1O_11235, partial [Terriglobia bacterium]